MSLSEFLNMGGYGFFVWWSYGLFAIAILWLLLLPRIQKRFRLKEVRQQIALEQLREQRAGKSSISGSQSSSPESD